MARTIDDPADDPGTGDPGDPGYTPPTSGPGTKLAVVTTSTNYTFTDAEILAAGGPWSAFTIKVTPVNDVGSGPAGEVAWPIDPDAEALIARMTVAPDLIRQARIARLIRSLKADGVWAKLDCLWVMAAHDAQAGTLNWKGASNTLAGAGGTPSFTVDQGYQGNGTSQIFNTGFIPGTGITLRDDHHLSLWCLSNTAVGVAEMGADTVSIACRTNADAFATRSASTTVSNAASTDGRGLWSISRSAGAGYDRYHDGALVDSPVVASAAFGGVYPVYLCGRNNSGTAGYNSKQLAAASIGAALDAAGQAALHDALHTFLDALGAV